MLPARAAAAVVTVPDVTPGIEALRAGRFDAARDAFAAITARDTQAPEGPFFQAFHLWWRLVDHPEDQALRQAMEERLSESARRASLLMDTPDPADRQRGELFQGVSMMLDAQSQASRGVRFGAASLVRQGHKALSHLLETAPDSADAMFAMGAYNYYADRLPPIVKGIRFLLLIPGGDSVKGIAQLEQAAEKSRLFGAESLMLLAHIYSGAYEVDYRRALAYVDRAAARYPGSPLISLARADLLFKLGDLRESMELSGRTLGLVERGAGYAIELERALAFRDAECRLKLNDPLDAMTRIDSGLQRSMPETIEEKKRWLALWVESARDTGGLSPDRLETMITRLGIPDVVADPMRRRAAKVDATRSAPALARAEALHLLASGNTPEAIRRLGSLREHAPDDLRLRYDLGRILQQEGRMAEARPHLQAVAELARSAQTADLAGWALLRLGWEIEQEGRRGEALALYRRAATLKQFTFQPAALDRLARPSPAQPEG
ncbi:MAG TPA: tetratricopeptide repeat protein [Patescibacteria group bacterium]|nr:tetratricopeptide repeat protein [Patescibacteria group bacterium]